MLGGAGLLAGSWLLEAVTTWCRVGGAGVRGRQRPARRAVAVVCRRADAGRQHRRVRCRRHRRLGDDPSAPPGRAAALSRDPGRLLPSKAVEAQGSAGTAGRSAGGVTLRGTPAASATCPARRVAFALAATLAPSATPRGGQGSSDRRPRRGARCTPRPTCRSTSSAAPASACSSARWPQSLLELGGEGRPATANG